MKYFIITFLFVISLLQVNAQTERTGLFGTKPIDSTYFKSGSFYLTTSADLGLSAITNNEFVYTLLGPRYGFNWVSKKRRKFQILASAGLGFNDNTRGFVQYDVGFLIGKIIKGKRSGFYDLNAGISATGRVHNDLFDSLLDIFDIEEVSPLHTIGIPFDLAIYNTKRAAGVGIGLVGNVNIGHPYIAASFRIRFGNPILKKYSTPE